MFGDFCQDPTQSVLDYTGDVGALEYYLSCVGDNPLTDDVNELFIETADLTEALQEVCILYLICV
jgi:hypothetical protein